MIKVSRTIVGQSWPGIRFFYIYIYIYIYIVLSNVYLMCHTLIKYIIIIIIIVFLPN